MARHKTRSMLKPVIVMLIVGAIGLGGFAVLKLESLTGSPESFQLDLQEQLETDESLLGYRQSGELPLEMTDAHAIATGPGDRLYVSGKQVVHVLKNDGQFEREIVTKGTPRCLAVGSADHIAPGRLYVGSEGTIEVFDEQGQPTGTWDNLGEGALLTSIALTYDNVFVADAGNRVILRLATEGDILDRIGDERPGDGSPAGFIIPSPYFDVVADPNDLLYVVNPGARRIETYTLNGALEAVWGKAGSDIESFFGCCNPSHLAQLPDGRFVTSEKGIPRIKVYRANGEMDCVVAGPRQLDVRSTSLGDPRTKEADLVFDIAVDRQGRILVLDSRSDSIRVFVANSTLEDRKT
ncbi:MAG: NHL repeat-containing protein [Pirellulaceae bacterium]